MKRRRSRQYENEETVELGEVLEPYRQEPQWADEEAYDDGFYAEQPPQEEIEAWQDEYQDFYGEEYSDEHEMADNEGRFRIAMGMFDLISIIIGIVVILVLVSMLITLFNWLRNDILHSALLLQSGLQ